MSAFTKRVDGTPWIDFVRDELLPALKSGEYEQGYGQLQVPDGDDRYFCCLGVVCDIFANKSAVPIVTWEGLIATSTKPSGFRSASATALPGPLARLLDVATDPVVYRVYPSDTDGWVHPSYTTLSSINDGDPSGTFKDVIEVLEGALDPENHEWFFFQESPGGALDYITYAKKLEEAS